MSFTLVLIAFILVILVLPIWPYSRNWGYKPVALISIVALFLLIMLIHSITYIEIESNDGGVSIEIEKKAFRRRE